MEQIYEDLFQLAGLASNLRERRFHVSFQCDVTYPEAFSQKLKCIVQNGLNVHGVHLRSVAAAKCSQMVDDTGDSFDLPVGFLQTALDGDIVPSVVLHIFLRGLNHGVDVGKGLVYFVGDAGGNLTKCGQLGLGQRRNLQSTPFLVEPDVGISMTSTPQCRTRPPLGSRVCKKCQISLEVDGRKTRPFEPQR